MPALLTMIPDADTALALEPEELGGVLLRHLADLTFGDQNLSRHNFGSSNDTFRGYPVEKHEALREAFMEAWAWLEHQGLIIKRAPDHGGEWFRVTRRGRRVATTEGFAAFRQASIFPSHLLHRSLRDTVGSLFLRGDYDTAVFKAFRTVEVAVREKAGLDQAALGLKLMRDAFNPKDGPLTDSSAELGERESLAHLFAGAIGTFKNPTSHRHVVLEDPIEAIEMLFIASHLLRVVEARGGD